MGAFADVTDVEARWRPLTAGEKSRCKVLLEDASSLIRDTIPTWEEASAATLKRIACAVVVRAMNTPEQAGGGGVSSVQVTAGPYSQQVSYSNPGGDLYLTRAERAALTGGGRRAWSIDMTPAHVKDRPAWGALLSSVNGQQP